jgi:hypothetical protein
MAALVEALERLFEGVENSTLAAAHEYWMEPQYFRSVEAAHMTLGQLEALAFEYVEPSGPMGSMS